jgi:putative DNA primase/helicase
LSGIDLDHCAPGGQPDERSVEIMAGAGSYAEISVSGDGLHILGTGDIGTAKIKNGRAPGLEIYSGGRYFTVTGRHINRAGIADLSDGAALARKLFAAPDKDSHAQADPQSADDTLLNAIKGAGLYVRPGKGKHLIRCP